MNEDLFNLGVKAVISNSQREIFILTVNKNEQQRVKDWQGEIRYDLPGGRVKIGDIAEATLKREVKEETGMNIKSYKLITTLISKIRLNNEKVGDIGLILIIYDVEVEIDNIKLNKENTGYEWLSPKSAAEKLMTKYPKEFCDQISKL